MLRSRLFLFKANQLDIIMKNNSTEVDTSIYELIGNTAGALMYINY